VESVLLEQPEIAETGVVAAPWSAVLWESSCIYCIEDRWNDIRARDPSASP
jgi:hypothetical protein